MKSELIEALKASLPVGALAASIRVLLYHEKSWWSKILIFSTSLLISALIGIWANDLQLSVAWRSIVVGGGALLGKEVIEALIKLTPNIIKKLIEDKINKL